MCGIFALQCPESNAVIAFFIEIYCLKGQYVVLEKKFKLLNFYMFLHTCAEILYMYPSIQKRVELRNKSLDEFT